MVRSAGTKIKVAPIIFWRHSLQQQRKTNIDRCCQSQCVYTKNIKMISSSETTMVLRPINCELDILSESDGSAMLTQGEWRINGDIEDTILLEGSSGQRSLIIVLLLLSRRNRCPQLSQRTRRGETVQPAVWQSIRGGEFQTQIRTSRSARPVPGETDQRHLRKCSDPHSLPEDSHIDSTTGDGR